MWKNTANQVIGVQMVTTAGAAFTGAVSVYITKDNGTQTAAASGAGSPVSLATHKGNGYHSYTPSQTETNADHIAFTFIGSGAVPVTVQVYPRDMAVEADAYLKRDWTATDAASPSDVPARCALNAMRQIRNKWTLVGTDLTVLKEDDATVAWTGVVGTSAGAEPIISLDPD